MSNVRDLVGYKLRDLDDVNTSGLSAGQVLAWNGSMFVPAANGGSGPTGNLNMTDWTNVTSTYTVPYTVYQNTSNSILLLQAIAMGYSNDVGYSWVIVSITIGKQNPPNALTIAADSRATSPFPCLAIIPPNWFYTIFISGSSSGGGNFMYQIWKSYLATS